MAGKIFINYRRDDSAPHALAVAGYLENTFGKSSIFIDVDRVRAGQKFETVLEDKLRQCKVMLAIIGPTWVDAREGKTGSRRLDNPEDWVRIEIERSLARSIPVIPVLVAGAALPSKSDLPPSLQPLLKHQGATLTTNGFRYEMAGLARDVADLTVRRPWGRIAVVVSALIGWLKGQSAEGRIFVDAAIVQNANGKWFLPAAGKSEWFKDHKDGPEMVVVPRGSFIMGSPDDELQREKDQAGTESPLSELTIARPFAVARHAISRGQFAAFTKKTGYKIDKGALIWEDGRYVTYPNASWEAPGFLQDDSHPVVCISWDDAKAYAAWLERTTGQSYRLLSEAGREYVTRAGSATPFWWGSTIMPDQANYDCRLIYAGGGGNGKWQNSTIPVDSFEANPWGLYNVHGNVWEWCEDVWHDNYRGVPVDGSSWQQGGDKTRRVVRGGCWVSVPQNLRSAYRGADSTIIRCNTLGFRLARTLSP